MISARPVRSLFGASLVVVSLTVVVPQSQTLAASDLAPESIEYLIPEGHDALDEAGVEVVRSIGFGWFLATGPDSLVDAMSPATASAHSRRNNASAISENESYSIAADPLFDQQWGLENTGQEGGTPDADIDILGAWPASEGESTVIAVIDSGIDLDHPDLVDRLWTNGGEIPANSLDDDGNGYIDDVVGWDMVDRDSEPEGVHPHGTAVAGVAVASINGVGVAGVAPGASVMALRACGTTQCSWSDVGEAIGYATDNGADIINLSLGGFGYSQTLSAAVAYANAAGVVVVAAAGNSGADNDVTPYYPASFDYPNIVSVAATDRTDSLASFPTGGSHWGRTSVDLAAPGSDILTTAIDGWSSWYGTSFAAPMVAGVSALILDLVPAATPPEIRQILIDSVDVLPVLDGLMVSGGRLNAASAAAMSVNVAPVASAAATPEIGWVPAAVQVDGSDSYDPDGSIVSWDWSSGETAGTGEATTLNLGTVGVHEISLTVTDNRGATDTDNSTVYLGTDFLDTRMSIFRTDIAWMSAIGVTRGCNPPVNDLFCPDGDVTRGQMAAFINRQLDLAPTSEDFFVDDANSVFEDDINRLAAAGITRGCNPPTNDQFCPSQRLTRAQLAAFLSRAFDLSDTSTDFFDDDDDSIFEPDINRLAAAGITRGCNPPTNTHYCPDTFVSRAQTAAFFRRANF